MRRSMFKIPRWSLIYGVSSAFLLASAWVDAGPSDKTSMHSDALPLPSGEILLIVNGAIKRGNVTGEAHLDMRMLQALPVHTLTTTTAVTDGVSRFDGFLMRDILNLIGAQGTLVEARALNNYSVDIPIADFHGYDVILATHQDEKRLLPTGKGPFWIVYPRDDWRQLQDIRYDYRWVWQVNRLTVK